MSINKKVHHVQPRQLGDRAFFAIAVATGVIGTLTVKALGASPLYVALVPVLVLLAYATMSWYLPRFALEPDLIGDNCYYLGFMLTLVSLSWTLYGVSKAPEDLDLIREIVSGFGIALSSTIAGIFLRAFFLQMRPDIDTGERRSRQDILTAARGFRGQLSESSKDIKLFSTGVQQALKEHQYNLNKASSEAMVSQRELMKKHTFDAAEEIVKVYRESTNKMMTSMSISVDETTAKFRSSLESSSNSMQAFVDKFSSQIDHVGNHIEAQTRNVESSVEGIDAAVVHAASAVETVTSSLTNQLSEGIDRISETMQGTYDQFAAFGAGINQSVDSMRLTLTTASDEFADTLSNSAANIVRAQSDAPTTQLSEEIDKITESMQRTYDQFMAFGNGIDESVNSMRLTLASASDQFANTLSSSSMNILQAQSDALTTQLSEGIDRITETMQGKYEQLSNFGTGINESIDSMRLTLTTASDQFADTLSNSSANINQAQSNATANFQNIAKQLNSSSEIVKESAITLSNIGEQVAHSFASLETAENMGAVNKQDQSNKRSIFTNFLSGVDDVKNFFLRT
jgi:hypothetical protein